MNEREIDQMIMRIKRLVASREIARRAGADRRELAERSEEISLLRSRLADRVRRSLSGDLAGASARAPRDARAIPNVPEMHR